MIFYEFNFIARVSFISQQVGNDFFEYHKLSPFIFIMQLFIRFNFVTRTCQTIDEKDMNFNQPYSYAIHTQAILFLLFLVHWSDKGAKCWGFFFGIIFFLKKIYVTKRFRNPYLSMEMATSVRTLTKTNKGWKYDMKEQSPSLRKMFQRHGAVNSNSLSGVTIADTRKSDTARFTM